MSEQEEAIGHLKILVNHLQKKAAQSRRYHDCGEVNHVNNGTPSARALEVSRLSTLEDEALAKYAQQVWSLFNDAEPETQTTSYDQGTQTFTLSTTRSGKQYLRN